jgi:hypothetical protein
MCVCMYVCMYVYIRMYGPLKLVIAQARGLPYFLSGFEIVTGAKKSRCSCRGWGIVAAKLPCRASGGQGRDTLQCCTV